MNPYWLAVVWWLGFVHMYLIIKICLKYLNSCEMLIFLFWKEKQKVPKEPIFLGASAKVSLEDLDLDPCTEKRRRPSLMGVDITQFIEYLSRAKRQRKWKFLSRLIHLLLPSSNTDHCSENLDYRTECYISFSAISQDFSFSYTIRSFASWSTGLSKLLITDFSGSLVQRQTVYHGVPQPL